jgi:hypothetical protein
MPTNLGDTTITADTEARETPSLIASDKVHGTAVRRSDGESVGSIERLMIDKRSGYVAYAVVSFGGFLGLGTDHYALPWNALRYNPRLDAYELNIADERLRNAPRYDESNWTDRHWEQGVHEHYGVEPYWL